jgi:lipoyl(octanoyl) transferase
MNGAAEIRLIVDPPAPGSWNMAVDEAILIASAEENVATLRLYEWDEPTLSLGYFQRHEDRHEHKASRGCPVVRRQSGGGAIVHDRELTYSLTLPPAHPWARRSEQLYAAVHKAIIRVLGRLSSLGPDVVSLAIFCDADCQPPSPRQQMDHQPFLCFERRSPNDVVLATNLPEWRPSRSVELGWKIVGSAQRHYRGSILQHGSVLLRQSSAAPELPGYCDIVGKTITVSTLAAAFPTEVVFARKSSVARAQLPEPIYAAAQQISRDKYASTSWTCRR